MTTVSEEMPDEERRKRLLHGLKATGVEEVAVNFSHLAQAVGMEKAESLVVKMAETRELQASAMSRTPVLKREGICSIKRTATIEAIEAIMEAAPTPANPPQEEPEPDSEL